MVVGRLTLITQQYQIMFSSYQFSAEYILIEQYPFKIVMQVKMRLRNSSQRTLS